VTIPPTVAHGLRQPSQIMIDKAMTIMRTKIGETFGRLDAWRRHSIKPQRFEPEAPLPEWIEQ
jgi:hypothetical protein